MVPTVLVDLAIELPKQPKWMHKDGVHPSTEGNTIIADQITKVVQPFIRLR